MRLLPGRIPGTSMSKPLSRRSRDSFAGIPHIYSASPGSGIPGTAYWNSGTGIPGTAYLFRPRIEYGVSGRCPGIPDEVKYVAERGRMDYNHYRPHSSLSFMTPAGLAQRCRGAAGIQAAYVSARWSTGVWNPFRNTGPPKGGRSGNACGDSKSSAQRPGCVFRSATLMWSKEP